MGILGCNAILTDPRILRGLYHARATRYNIYVDGELIRFKGMTNDNLTHRFVEETIARASHTYLQRLLNRVQRHLSKKPQLVMVYMDGERVINKTERKNVYEFDVALVRSVFVKLCRESGYAVCLLTQGESELQMYLRRDRETELNVFVTNDSDMISICYGHEARIEMKSDEETMELRSLASEVALDTVLDHNCIYRESVSVKDSCLWVKCASSEIRVYGMDDIAKRMNFSKRAFRVFVSACGTDFTRSILTNTMISAILGASSADQEALRAHEHDDLEILVALIYLAVKNGATLKRVAIDGNEGYVYRESIVRDIIDAYASYIETGDMKRDIMPVIDGSMLVMEIVYAMTCGVGIFTKKYLREWSSRVTMARAVQNFKENVGRYTVFARMSRDNAMTHEAPRGGMNEALFAKLRTESIKAMTSKKSPRTESPTIKSTPLSLRAALKRQRDNDEPRSDERTCKRASSIASEILLDDNI